MSNNEHPITPPSELQEEWLGLWPQDALLQAARWGWQQRDASVPGELQKARDEELKACCKWLKGQRWEALAIHLRTARRPKPPSLKEQALEALKHAEEGWRPVPADCDIIRRALERLQELEGQE